MEKKTIAVIGASGGIGREIVGQLIEEGYEIIAVDKDPGVKELEGGGITGLNLDLRSTAAYGRIENELAKREALYGVIFAAGIMIPGKVEEVRMEDWESTMEVNLTSVFRLTQLMLPYLLKNKVSHVITLASHVGVVGSYELTAYSTSKAALIEFTKCLALDYGGQGLMANSISPGFIKTDMLSVAMKRFAVNKQWMFSVGGLPKQYVDVADVVRVVSLLLKQQSMNGENVIIDAGYTVR
ncbi:MAG: SDR family NAD(P)-dependent oxidoreductase [Anaerovoracaceae bacterium]|jgi:NAD(P)-dependent dehydrogenase (short-subunit alcohol dehydrogenase family)